MDLQQAVRTIASSPDEPVGSHPDEGIPEPELDEDQCRHIAGLMRVNHAGEVSAQALYQGQALVSRHADVRDTLRQAAQEEHAHLIWCRRRLAELGHKPSRLTPAWYFGSLGIGMLAGLAGDRWSLGFVVETENQVIEHIDRHLDELPVEDGRTRAILEQMKHEEAHHGETARRAGGRELPWPVKRLMNGVSKLMTQGAKYV